MRSIYSRGLNFHGQCGLGKNVAYSLEKFTKIPDFPCQIKKVSTNIGHTLALDEDERTVYYWGFNWDLRSFFRTSMAYQNSPKLLNLAKKFWSPLKSYPHSPVVLHTFENKIVDIQVGGAHCLVLDNKGKCYGIGENSDGQITKKSQFHYKFTLMNESDNIKFKKISAGFQTSLLLDEEGNVYGCGKCDKFQFGSEYIKEYERIQQGNLGPGLFKIDLKDIKERIIQIGAGKYHSLFLTDRGNVFTIGINRFGQLGESNLSLPSTSSPIKMEFPTQEKIKEIQVGDSHNLMLSEDNLLYANGDNTSGQVDGDLENFLYYLCTPKIVPLQIEPGVKIEKMWARNNRSAALLSNGDLCYWGGFSYHPDYGLKNLPKYDGINIFNREEGIPANSKMIDIGLGIFHDILLVEEF